MFNSIILALSASMDALGLGITYGLKNAKVGILSKCIIFFMSLFFSSCALFIGDFISSFLSTFITDFISSAILIFIGILIFIDPIPFDFDNSRTLDVKESLVLGIAVSFDATCVGIGAGISGLSSFYFPILVSLFHLTFLLLGIRLREKCYNTF